MIDFHDAAILIQRAISFSGIFIIFVGVVIAFLQFAYHLIKTQMNQDNRYVNGIRLRLGRIIILGLEFIISADLIASTNTPSYYDLGILAIIVAVRTVLSYTLNREIESLTKEQSVA